MTRKKAARRLKKLVEEIYNKLGELEDILKEVTPEELSAEEAYWIALLSFLEDALGTLKRRRNNNEDDSNI